LSHINPSDQFNALPPAATAPLETPSSGGSGARPFSFDLGYRLSLVLEPDGRVRTVAEVSGIGTPPAEAFIGLTIMEIAARRDGGPARAQTWIERLSIAHETSTAAHYADPPPGAGPEVAPSVDCTVTPIRRADGELESILLVVQDRTAFLETQRRLGESEERFRMLAEALPQMVFVGDPNGNVIYFAPGWTTFTGRSQDQLIGRGYVDLIHPDDFAAVEAYRGNSITGRPVTFRMRRADGAWRWMESYVQSVRDETGQVVRRIGGTTDITERRAAEDQSREYQHQLRSALALTGLGRYTLDLRAQRVVADDRVHEIMGSKPTGPDTTAVDPLFSSVHPDDVERVHDAFLAAAEHGIDFDVEHRILRPSDSGSTEERWVAVLGRIESDADGPARMIGVIEDTTAQRHAAEARSRTQKREAIGTLAAGIAHDFNNVIGAILSNASVAQTEIAAGLSPATSVTEIARGAVRAADLVRRMLAYSREDESVAEPIDLADVAREACALLRPTFPPSIALVQTLTPGLRPVSGNSNHLHQVVMNLVTNARQALGEQAGTVEVVLDEVSGSSGPQLRLRVIDDGPGMPEAVQRRAFEPFFTTKPADEGTGLGLAAVQTIVRGHDGTITLSSSPGSGTTFTALFPMTAEPTPQPVGDPLDGAETAAGEPAEPRVLFVDDEPALSLLAERAMPAYGCQAAAFTDPIAAFEAFSAAPDEYDAIVTDLSMPGMTGFELIDKVRALRPGIPAVLTSGFLSAQHRDEAEAREIDAILPKPCSVGDLAATVRELLHADGSATA
jgi:PAS domain S-box-containing protein